MADNLPINVLKSSLMNENILIYGGGSLCRVVESMLSNMSLDVKFIFDSNMDAYQHQTNANFSNKISDLKKFIEAADSFVVAIGNDFGFARCEISQILEKSYKLNPINLISSAAFVDDTVSIGRGNIIMPGVQINKFVSIGNYNIIGLGAKIDHESLIHNGSHIMGSSLLNGRVVINNFATIGSGAIIFPDILIEEDSFVGAGSLVDTNVEKNSIVVGSPCRFLKLRERRIDLSPFTNLKNQ